MRDFIGNPFEDELESEGEMDSLNHGDLGEWLLYMGATFTAPLDIDVDDYEEESDINDLDDSYDPDYEFSDDDHSSYSLEADDGDDNPNQNVVNYSVDEMDDSEDDELEFVTFPDNNLEEASNKNTQETTESSHSTTETDQL